MILERTQLGIRPPKCAPASLFRRGRRTSLRVPFMAVLLSGVGTATVEALSAQPVATRRDPQAFIDSIASAALASWSIPGMSIVVTRGSNVVLAKGYGLANRETRTGATPRTVYQIGSISKQFTAAGVMRLVERRRLHLDDPVSRHLPEYRPHGDSVRLRHLLHQTSGIREEFMLPRYGELITDTTRTNAELMALIEREPLGFVPGSRWSYSNSNYALLAAIIERTTGKRYEQFLAEALFEPLALTSLHHCAPLPTEPHHARGYVLDGERITSAPAENMNWIRGDGGMCASAEDLARWARALATGRAVTRDTYRRMVRSERLGDGIIPEYGFALSLVPLDGKHRRISHGGRMAGFTGVLAYYPDHDVAIAILTNRSGLWLEAVEQAIARAVFGLPRAVVRDVALTARERQAYVGTYDVGIAGMMVRITERDGELWLEWPAPGPTSNLMNQGGREFAATLEPDAIRVRFEAPDRSGRSRQVRVLMAGMHWYGRRVQ